MRARLAEWRATGREPPIDWQPDFLASKVSVSGVVSTTVETIPPLYVQMSGSAVVFVNVGRTAPSIPPPPKRAEQILWFVFSQAQREGMLGDLAEAYATHFSKFGLDSARWWYWEQVLKSVGAGIIPTLRRLAITDLLLRHLGL